MFETLRKCLGIRMLWGRQSGNRPFMRPIRSGCWNLVAQIFRIARPDLGEFAQRSRQMGAQMLLGPVGIAGIGVETAGGNQR